MDTVHSVWVGSELSVMERLSIILAQKAGFQVVLWSYDNLKDLPAGTILQRIPTDILEPVGFCGRPEDNLPNKGIGSYSHWSDYFAFKTLQETGGYWMQLDCAILNRIPIKESYAFIQWYQFISPVFMKIPPQSNYAKAMAAALEPLVKIGYKDCMWGTSMHAMSNYAAGMDVFNDCKIINEHDGYVDCGGGHPSPYNTPTNNEYTFNYSMVHWSNATYNHCKTEPIPGTLYYRLCQENNLI
jgi:hypothetical protein